jgi:hypothetical protein
MKGTPLERFKAVFERTSKKIAKSQPVPRIVAAKGG